MKKATTAITITDPLVKYQTLVSTGVYTPDLAQHRLAHHLQKLYLRLRDYSPAPEQRRRLQQIAQAVSIKTQDVPGQRNEASDSQIAVDHHPIWRNPLISRFLQRTERRDSLSLTRVLTSHQAALEMRSPRGLVRMRVETVLPYFAKKNSFSRARWERESLCFSIFSLKAFPTTGRRDGTSPPSCFTSCRDWNSFAESASS